jgi:TetR/AcrR family transcriptional repressor of nem operon
METANPGKSERTRRSIIEKAAPLINKKGAAGTSIAELTAATGLTKGGIYGNFKNKEELVLAVYDYQAESLNRVFAREIAKPDTPGQKLAACPAIFHKLYAHTRAYGGCPILNTATEADDTHPALCRRVAHTIDALKHTLAKLIDQGVKTGEIRPETDAERTAGLFLSLFEGGGMLARVTKRETFMTEAIDHIEALINDIRVPLK